MIQQKLLSLAKRSKNKKFGTKVNAILKEQKGHGIIYDTCQDKRVFVTAFFTFIDRIFPFQ
jgi:hypothetical protein